MNIAGRQCPAIYPAESPARCKYLALSAIHLARGFVLVRRKVLPAVLDFRCGTLSRLRRATAAFPWRGHWPTRFCRLVSCRACGFVAWTHCRELLPKGQMQPRPAGRGQLTDN